MRKLTFFRSIALLLVLASLIGLRLPAAAAPLDIPASLDIQQFLEQQPGILKHYREDPATAAQIIEAYTSYYGLDPRIILTLLEVVPHLLTDPNAPAERLHQPFGAAGPAGFSQQIEWAARNIKAQFGPYAEPPVVQFVDGTSTTLDPTGDPAVIAVQRFLAQGRTQAEWHLLADAYAPLYASLWGNDPLLAAAAPVASRPFLQLPWPAGTKVIHTSYFDHKYPTVDFELAGAHNALDRFKRGAGFALDYLGRSGSAYPTHDGHDYSFPDQPIGTPILAAAPGIAYALSTYGNGVIIQHGGEYAGYATEYWHLDQFASIFDGKVDTGIGVLVDAGTQIGTSGQSGRTDGGAHLHFEVKHNGKQVDPYGWYGTDPDPCAEWSGCATSVWLWDDSLRGSYDFTQPDAPVSEVPVSDVSTSTAMAQGHAAEPEADEPLVGSLAVAPEPDLLFLAPFDGNVVPTIGYGLPNVNNPASARPRFTEGKFEQGIMIPANVDLTYPMSGNFQPERGTFALWAKLPAKYPESQTNRFYLWTASADPNNEHDYANTLALRHEVRDDGDRWNFWSVDEQGVRHDLFVTDTLSTERWHHFAVAWDQRVGGKALFIDGELVTQTVGVSLPTTLGERLQVGRFTTGFGASEATLDEFAVWGRVLSPHEIKRLATGRDLYTHAPGPITTARAITGQTVILDTNAMDRDGGPISVQLRRDDEAWTEPMPYYDSYRWTITGTEGVHTFSARYTDRSNNEIVATTTLELQPPLTGSAAMLTHTDTATLFELAIADSSVSPQPQGNEQDWLTQEVKADMQLGEQPDFVGAFWEPFDRQRMWTWKPGQPRQVYIRFRDNRGRVSDPILAGPDVITQ
jgi:murein DD-endopeptidase MepM/ murein hydrolase activator NlpD